MITSPATRLSAVAAIVHDLRNPLAAIHGGAEMLVDSTLSPAQAHRIARNIYAASVSMGQLLDEFLDQTTRAGRKTELSDVYELVTGAVDKVAVAAELQAVRIVCDVPVGLTIMRDRRRIRRVLVNLLVNALEAMPQGGRIHISVISDHHSISIRVAIPGQGSLRKLGIGFSNHSQRQGRRMGSVWVLPFHAKPCSITAAKCGSNRLSKARVLHFASRRIRKVVFVNPMLRT